MALAHSSTFLTSSSPSSSSSRSRPGDILPTSSLAGRAGFRFTAHTMIEGFACHARGVEVKSQAPKRIHTRVRGKRTHDVHLAAEDGKLVIACSCAALSMGVDVCKHMWAALLEVDKMGGLESLSQKPGPIMLISKTPAELNVPPPPAPPLFEEEPPSKAKTTKTKPKKASAETAAAAAAAAAPTPKATPLKKTKKSPAPRPSPSPAPPTKAKKRSA